MKKLVSTIAACLMIAGAGLVAAPAASAYPAGSDPSVGIIGKNRKPPQTLTGVRAFNFQPGCSATMTAGDITRTRTVRPNGQVVFNFRSPKKTGTVNVVVTQPASGSCLALQASNQITVR